MLAWNSGGDQLAFPDNAMDKATTDIQTALFHEIRHNWEELAETTFAQTFRAVGGWEDFAGKKVPSPHEQAHDNAWSSRYFDNRDSGLDSFTRDYERSP